jgi:hypothetical protein
LFRWGARGERRLNEAAQHHGSTGRTVVVVFCGEWSFNEGWDLLKQTYDAALEERVNLILVDTLAVEGKLTTFDSYKLGTETVAHFRSRHMHPRIALVGKPPVDGFRHPKRFLPLTID